MTDAPMTREQAIALCPPLGNVLADVVSKLAQLSLDPSYGSPPPVPPIGFRP